MVTKTKKTTKQPAKKKVGRPSMEFDQKTADRICELIADGKSLRTICKYKLMPSRPTVLKWLREVNSFAVEYARAHEDQAEFYAEELLSLSRQANSENANAIRVRADIIKWICSKLKPRKYADRVDLGVQADIRIPDQPTILESARRIAFLLARGADALQKTADKPMLQLPVPVEKEEIAKPVDVIVTKENQQRELINQQVLESIRPLTAEEEEEQRQLKYIDRECEKQRQENFAAAYQRQRPSRWNR